MIRYLAFSIAAHALDAAYRSACAVGETVAIAWDHLTAPAPLAGGDPLDGGRFRQEQVPADAQEMTGRIVDLFADTYRCDACDAIATMSASDRARCIDRVAPVLTAWLETHRAHANPSPARAEIARAMREVERAEHAAQLARVDLQRLRANLEEMQAQRNQAEERWSEAAQNLSAAQAVIADLRRECDEARADAERAMAIAAGRQDVLDRMAERLGARDFETPPQAAERVVRERDEATKNLAAAREVIADLKAAITDLRAARDQARARIATLEAVSHG